MKIVLTIASGIHATVEVIPEEGGLVARVDTLEERADRHYTLLEQDARAIGELRRTDAETAAEVVGGPFQNVYP